MHNEDTNLEESPLDQIIADYLEAEESGHPPDRDGLIETHPEHAEDLRNFFASRDRFNALFDDDVPPHHIRYFGDYELLEEIARGGMGIVYKARQKSLNRIVAVKMIRNEPLSKEDDLQRFREEARAAANLQHSGIVSVHEVGIHQGMHYFSMDYVQGRSLADVARDAPLSAQRAARYVLQIAEAVDIAHREGILHRDIKPSNVLIDQNDRVQITDFGLALQVEGDSELTRTGQVLGTPSYMPPEQAQNKRGLIGPSSDIYAIGAVFYELLTGRPPFRADSAVKTLKQVIETEPASPRLLNPEVPKDLETICLKCLQKEPHKRYPTAQRLADDLDRYLQGKPIVARPIGTLARIWRWCRRKPAVASLSASMILLLAATAMISSLSAMRLEEQRDRAVAAEQLAKRRLTRALEAESHAQAQAKLATREAERANAVIELLQEMLGSADPDASLGADYTLRELLDEFSARMEAQLQSQPEVEATLRHIIGSVYRRLDSPEQAQRHLQRALALRRRVLGQDDAQVADTLYQMAFNEYEIHHPRKAETLVRNAMTVYRAHSHDLGILKAKWLLMLCQRAQGKPSEATETGRQAIDLANRSEFEDHAIVANIMHVMADMLIHHRQEYAAGEELVRKSLAKHLKVHGPQHPETAFAWRILGDALAQQGKHAEGQRAFRKSLDIFRRNFPDKHTFVERAVKRLLRFLQERGEQDELDNLSAEYPDFLELYLARAQIYVGDPEQFDRAIADVQHATELAPHDFRPWAVRARIHALLGQRDRAMEYLDKAVELHPDRSSTELLECRADIYLKAAEYDKAIKAYTSLIQRDSQNDWYYHERGFCHLCIGEYEQAVSDYSRVIDFNPRSVGAWRRRALAYAELGRWSEAAEDYATVVAFNDREHETWNRLGVAYCRSQQADKAKSAFDNAIELKPKYATYRRNRAYACLRLGRWSEAVADAMTATKLEPEDFQTWKTLGKTCSAYAEENRWCRMLKNASMAVASPSGVVTESVYLWKLLEDLRRLRSEFRSSRSMR